jgi:hypothetical protein
LGKRSPYRTTTTIKDGILEIAITGEVTEDSVEKMWSQVFALVKIINTNCLLIDVSTLEGRFGYMANIIKSEKILSFGFKWRNAFIDNTENYKNINIIKASANSVGMNLRCFTDIDEARTWLKSKPQLVSP